MRKTVPIGFDLSVALNKEPTGVERAALGLAAALAQRADLHVLFFAPRRIPGFSVIGARDDEAPQGPSLAHWRRRVLPKLAVQAEIEVLHAPVSHCPVHPRFFSVRTIHDLGRLDDGEVGVLGRWMARRSFKRALPTVFPSAAVATDWRNQFGTANAPQFVIPHGLDDGLLSASKKILSAKEGTLIIGRRRERRRAGLLAKLIRTLDFPKPITWIGPETGSLALEGMTGRGFVSDEERNDLLAQSRLVLMPSTHEGFGLPLLEAMAFGCAVVAESLDALTEIGEGRAQFAALENQEEVGRALAQALALTPSQLASHRAYAQDFTWHRAAESYVAFYESLVRRDGKRE